MIPHSGPPIRSWPNNTSSAPAAMLSEDDGNRAQTVRRQIEQRGHAQVVDDGQIALLSQADQFFERYAARTPNSLDAAQMCREQRDGLRCDRLGVIVESEVVDGANFFKPRVGGSGQIG